MVRDDELRAFVAVDLSAQAADRALDTDQQFRGELAEATDDPRLERRELAAQIRRARFDLVRQRIAVLGRTALEHVRDEHRAAIELHTGNQLALVHRLDDLREELPRAA